MENEDQQCNFYISPKTTIWGRIRRRLFPARFCRPPTPDFELQDMLFSKTVCGLSLVDRLRIMVTGRLVVETRTATENVIGRHAVSSTSYVATKSMTDK